VSQIRSGPQPLLQPSVRARGGSVLSTRMSTRPSAQTGHQPVYRPLPLPSPPIDHSQPVTSMLERFRAARTSPTSSAYRVGFGGGGGFGRRGRRDAPPDGGAARQWQDSHTIPPAA
jgi:hypothetical protein